MTPELTPGQLLSERGRVLLESVLEEGLRVSAPNLEAKARRTWGKLKEAEITDIATAAMQLHGRKPTEGPNPDWPVRTVRRPPAAAVEPKSEVTPSPQGLRPAPKTSKMAAVMDALRAVLPKHPSASVPELYDLVAKTGIEMCALSSFHGHIVGPVRRELGIPMKSGPRAKPEPPAPAPAAAARPAQPAERPAPARTAGRGAAPQDEIRVAGPGLELVATRAGASWDVKLTGRIDPAALRELVTLAGCAIGGAAA